MNNVFNISHYKKDGFQKVCDVNHSYGEWYYSNIDTDLMFADHRSWVYFIVLDNEIVKAGETGNPLGISENWVYGDKEAQPKKSSKSRLGRYRGGDNTDSHIRRSLHSAIVSGCKVTIWAKKCPIKMLAENVGGQPVKICHSFHKDLEQAYLRHFVEQSNRLPLLNKAHK
jgi:hypothetical protein